jgi:hypothetical protein
VTPEKAARWLVMSSYLYYQRSVNVLSDGEYDEVSEYVAENFDELSAQMQWQLESPEAIRATGNGIKITKRGESAAILWYETNVGKMPEDSMPIAYKSWKKSKKYDCYYSVIGG